MSPQELGVILLKEIYEHTPIVLYIKDIIKAGADLDVSDVYGCTPLLTVARCGSIEVVKALVEAGAPLEAQDQDGWTALHYAACLNRFEVIKIFLEAGASKEAKDNEGETPWDLTNNHTRNIVPQLNPLQ